MSAAFFFFLPVYALRESMINGEIILDNDDICRPERLVDYGRHSIFSLSSCI